MTQLNCTQCHASLSCQANDITACWCNELPAILPLNASTTSCLCRNCMIQKINTYLTQVYRLPLLQQIKFAKPFRDHENLIEGLDYTMQNDYMVFTRWFFLKRGSCCKNKCLNCPYGVKSTIN